MTFIKSHKVNGNVTVQSSTCDFLLPFHSNYGPILYRFPLTKFVCPNCIQCPHKGDPIGIAHRYLVLGKLEWVDTVCWRE